MQQYLDLVAGVIKHGTWRDNRTGVRTKSVPGATINHDMRLGFPAVTTKRLAFKSVAGELVGFLRGYTSAEDFRALGCKIWDQNANENEQWLNNPNRKGEDHLGPIYGDQWRGDPAYKVFGTDELERIEQAKAQGYYVLGTINGSHPKGSSIVLHKKVDQVLQCLEKIINDPQDRR